MFSTNVYGASMLDNLKELIENSNHFVAAVGYIGETAISQLLPSFNSLIRRNGRAELFLGRAAEEGLFQATIVACRNLHNQLTGGGGGVFATRISFHSKIYKGQIGGQDIAWIGSSNLSSNGMFGWREANIRITSNNPTMQEILDEINSISNSRTSLDVVPVIPTRGRQHRMGLTQEFQEYPSGPILRSLELPLYSRKQNEVQTGQGLNWWNGGGRPRDANEACIALSVRDIRNNIDFFPNRAHRGTIFTAYTDDGFRMQMQIEGNGPSDSQGGRFGKQIATTPRKADFGEWILRRKLNLPTQTLITRDLLRQRAGRETIEFIKLNNNEFIIRF